MKTAEKPKFPLIIALLCCALLFALPLSPEIHAADVASGSENGVYWVLSDEGELTIGTILDTGISTFTYVGARVDTSYGWYDYRDQITSVNFIGDVLGNGSMASMFSGYTNLVSANLSNFHANATSSLASLFSGCSSLTDVRLSSDAFTGVESLYEMFKGCSSLTSLDLSGQDTASVTSMAYMFQGCSSLETLDISGFDTSLVGTFDAMFQACSSLTELRFTSFSTDTDTPSCYDMFNGCSSLTELDLSTLRMTGTVTNMFYKTTALEKLTLGSYDNLDQTYFNQTESLPSVHLWGVSDDNYQTAMSNDTLFPAYTSGTGRTFERVFAVSYDFSPGTPNPPDEVVRISNARNYELFEPNGTYTLPADQEFSCWTQGGVGKYPPSTEINLTQFDDEVIFSAHFRSVADWEWATDGSWATATLRGSGESLTDNAPVFLGDSSTCDTFGDTAYSATVTFNPGTDSEETYEDAVEFPTDPHHNLVHHDAVAATCTDDGSLEYWECTRFCGQYFSDEAATTTVIDADDIVVPALGHDWGEPSYTWADDNSTVTATRVCGNDASHVETETADVRSAEIAGATCTEAGTTSYTAAFTNTAFAVQEKTLDDIPALGHDWGEPSYTWAEGSSVVNAQRVCANDASHVETESRAVSTVTIEATCTEPGTTIYTATFTNAAFAEQSKTVEDSPALGHDWGEPSYTWADDNSTVTASRVCERDASHVETETVAASAEVTTAATCTEAGTTRYTAVFTNAAFAAQEKTLDDIPALGHDWGEPSYTWADDNSTVTAERVCANDTSHVETETAAASAAVTRAAICTEAGTTTYTATFTNAAFASQEKAIDNIPPLGHDWGAPTYTWADDNSTVTAACVCANDASHVETETVAASAAVVKAATCTEVGTTRYTASFTNTAFASQEKTLDDIPALGHDWGEPTYTWAEDNGSVTATRVCANDASHVETETVLTAVEEVKPTCRAKGELRYTAVFTNAGFAEQHKKISDIPALEHRLQFHEAVDATCTEAGSVEYWECADCGAFFADARGAEEITDHDSVITPALGHDYRAAWDKDATGHWHICTRCHQKDFVRPHTADYFPTVENPSLCEECGYEIDPKLLIQSHAYFGSTGDLDITTVTFTKTKILDDDWIVLLPEQVPKRDGYYFEGWLCSSDIRTHAPGTTLPFTYAQCKSVIVRGLWTEVIGEGNHTLGAGVRYRFDEGSFMIAGDGSVYGGEQAFYSPYSGSLNVMKAG